MWKALAVTGGIRTGLHIRKRRGRAGGEGAGRIPQVNASSHCDVLDEDRLSSKDITFCASSEYLRSPSISLQLSSPSLSAPLLE